MGHVTCQKLQSKIFATVLITKRVAFRKNGLDKNSDDLILLSKSVQTEANQTNIIGFPNYF